MSRSRTKTTQAAAMADQMQHHHHHNPQAAFNPVPHGPDTGDDHMHFPGDRGREADIFNYLLKPDDLYNSEGVYWADLPLTQRFKFTTHVDNVEAKKELAQIGAMMKKDPLSPVGWYASNAIVPGAGLGLEGYVLSNSTKQKSCG